MLPSIEGSHVVFADDPVEFGVRMLLMQRFERVNGVRSAAALELHRRHPDIVVSARGQLGHGEAVMARRRGTAGLERLLRGGNVEDAIPPQRGAHGEHGLEVTAMEGIERAAADADSHTEAVAAARDSRTTRASARTSGRTPSPMTAEISK